MSEKLFKKSDIYQLIEGKELTINNVKGTIKLEKSNNFRYILKLITEDYNYILDNCNVDNDHQKLSLEESTQLLDEIIEDAKEELLNQSNKQKLLEQVNESKEDDLKKEGERQLLIHLNSMINNIKDEKVQEQEHNGMFSPTDCFPLDKNKSSRTIYEELNKNETTSSSQQDNTTRKNNIDEIFDFVQKSLLNSKNLEKSISNKQVTNKSNDVLHQVLNEVLNELLANNIKKQVAKKSKDTISNVLENLMTKNKEHKPLFQSDYSSKNKIPVDLILKGFNEFFNNLDSNVTSTSKESKTNLDIINYFNDKEFEYNGYKCIYEFTQSDDMINIYLLNLTKSKRSPIIFKLNLNELNKEISQSYYDNMIGYITTKSVLHTNNLKSN